MSIIYIISSLTLIIMAVLIKRKEEKIDIVSTILTTLIAKIAYNTLTCYVLNLINIPITLQNLSIINFVLAIVFIILIIKQKKIQKYYLNKFSIFMLILFVILTTIIISINFNGLTKIRYVSMDAREHYKETREFSENEFLGNKTKENNTNSPNFLPGAYTNVGIAFKTIRPFVGTIELYKVFIIMEAYWFVLIGMIFYFILEDIINNKIARIVTIIFSLIYVLGYPLNAWISGFHYLLLGILYVEMLVYLFTKEKNTKYKIAMMFFLNFELILSYPLFCVFSYISEIIIILINEYKENKKIKWKSIIQILIGVIVPMILGLVFLINPQYDKGVKSIALDGWIYKNLWSNFILLIPFVIYEVYKEIHDKKTFDYKNVIFYLLLVFMIILFIGTKVGKVSEYYFYKNYFILWLLMFINFVQGITKFIKEEKEKYIAIIYLIVYLLVFIIFGYTQKAYILNKNSDDLTRTMEVYSFNKTMMSMDVGFFMKNQIELMQKAQEYVSWKNNNYYIISDPKIQSWIIGLTGYDKPVFEKKEERIQKIQKKEIEYLIVFNNSKLYNDIKNIINMENYNLLYENTEGKIFKLKD